MRGRVGRCGMFLGPLAMFVSGSGVALGFFVFADSVVMLRLMVMMRGGMVMSRGQVMVLTGRVLRCLRHLDMLLIFWVTERIEFPSVKCLYHLQQVLCKQRKQCRCLIIATATMFGFSASRNQLQYDRS